MKNFKNRALLVIIGIICLIIAFNCFQSDFFQNNQNATKITDKRYGGLKINIIDNDTRTILPDFIAINHYDTTGDGPDGNKLSVENITGTSKAINSLLVGSWKLTVLGKDASNNIIAKGEATADIVEDQTTDVNIIVNYCQSGTGIVDLTIDWPGTISVDSVILKINNDATSEIYTTGDSVNYTNSTIPSGSHKFFFSIKNAGQIIAAVTESVHVYDYHTTSKTISLLSSDFKSAPVAPSGLSATEGHNKIVLNWTDNSNVETGFVVERSETSGTGFTALGGTDVTPLSANTTTFDDATAVIGTTYYYRVKAVNIYGNSDYCLEASGKYDLTLITFGRNGNTTPLKEQTTDVIVTDQSGLESGYPKHQWAQSATFPTEGTWTQFTSGDILSQSTGDGDYYLHIHALDSKGNESKFTSNKFVLDSPPTVGNSGNITYSDITSSSITVNWTDATDAVTSQENLEYLVYYSITADIDTVLNCENNGSAVGSYTADISSKAVSDLSSDTIYYFNVVVKDGAGNKNCYNMSSKGFYTITYNLDGGNNNHNNPVLYNEDTPDINLQAPTRTGYTFGGWYDNSGLIGTVITTIPQGSTGNKEFWAKWTGNTYTATLNKNGGTWGTDSVSAIYGSTMPTAFAPTKNGYTFAGYWDATSGGIQYYTNSMVSARTWDKIANTTLYARWIANIYTITFDKQNGSEGTNSVTATYNSSMPTATAPTRTGCTFAGYWDATSGGIQYYTNGMASVRTWDKTENTMLYARWIVIVTLNKNGGTGGTNSIVATVGSVMPTATAPTRSGYTFTGYWDATSDGVQYYTAAMGTGIWDKTTNTTLYARWTARTYTLTLNRNGGNGSDITVTATYDLDMPSAVGASTTRTGYTFDGYWNDISGGTQFYTAGMESARTWQSYSTTLYARWIAITHTVTFDKQGGSGGSDSVTATFDSAMPIATAPTRTDYTFAGYWDATSGGIQYYTNTMVSVRAWNKTANTILYARWAIIYGTVESLSVIEKRDFVSIMGGMYNQRDSDGNNFNHTISSYSMGIYQITYELWYTVRIWAIANGYTFVNDGREGAYGGTGTVPSTVKYEPVTTVSWCDIVIWCNAYSEMCGLTPVYYAESSFTTILKDASNVTQVVGAYPNWLTNGYRLPSEGEWEYAARWKGSDSSYGAEEFPADSGNYWTPFNYASGGTGAYSSDNYGENQYNYDNFGPFAWYGGSTTMPEGNTTKTRTVGTKAANQLGIYDISGNVREACWDSWANYPTTGQIDYRGASSGSSRVLRGGCWAYSSIMTQVGYRENAGSTYTHNTIGFRVAKTPTMWTPSTSIITFDKQSGTGGSDEVISTYGENMPSATAPTNGSETFIGYWDATSDGIKYYNADMSSAKKWNKTENTTLYARWVIYNLRDIGPAGGLIFYINPSAAIDGWKYLECSPQSTEWAGNVWGGSGTNVSGADGKQIGTGKQNTLDIVTQFGESEPYSGKTDYAAILCSNLVYNGFDDWFLPSQDELYQICWVLVSRGWNGFNAWDNPEYGTNRVGGFADDVYWSSSEGFSDSAYYQSFYWGTQEASYKSWEHRVRAIRAF